MLQIFVLAALLEVLVIAAPFYMQLVVDEVIVRGDADLLLVLAFGFGLGTVNLGGAWRAGPGQVGGRNELTSHQVALCRVSVSTGGDQPGGLAVFPLPAQP